MKTVKKYKGFISERRRNNGKNTSTLELSRRNDKNKKILVSTVGEQEKPIYEGIRYLSNISKIYLLASNYTKQYAEKIKSNISSIYLSKIIIIDEKEFEDIIKKLIYLHKENPNSEFIYNLTGGTKTMSIACYIVASLLGERVFYIFKKNEKEMEFFDLPILKLNIEFLNRLSDKKLKFLELIKEKPRTVTELSKLLKLSKPTLCLGYIDKLEEQNLISKIYISKKSQKINITKAGEIILLLKKELFKNG